MSKHTNIIIANWKMNPPFLREAEGLFKAIKKNKNKLKKTQIVVCPPFVFIEKLKNLGKKSKIFLGAQDCFILENGPWTGMTSPKMIKSVGADFVILGHSKRREMGETDDVINQKIKIALKNKLNVILCIGEEGRGQEGDYFGFLEDQINIALKGIGSKFVKNILVAYEPLWAIGKGSKRVINSDELQQISIFIKKVLADKYGVKNFSHIKILYGGSVDYRNAEDLIQKGGVDGFLVGRESLVPENFNKICNIVEKTVS